jgi:hypothetical protein
MAGGLMGFYTVFLVELPPSASRPPVVSWKECLLGLALALLFWLVGIVNGPQYAILTSIWQRLTWEPAQAVAIPPGIGQVVVWEKPSASTPPGTGQFEAWKPAPPKPHVFSHKGLVLGLLLGFLIWFVFFFTANKDLSASLLASVPLAFISGVISGTWRFITELRKKHHAADRAAPLIHEISGGMAAVPAELSPAPHFAHRLSPTRASWLCVSQAIKLDEKQRQQIAHLCQGHRDFDRAYQLSQAFVSMLAQRRATDLDMWLKQVDHSGIAELTSFAQGIRRDYPAVRAAFSSRWSNGQVEAQVNCLKLQKRLMFGRAKFDLLRLRVLHASY